MTHCCASSQLSSTKLPPSTNDTSPSAILVRCPPAVATYCRASGPLITGSPRAVDPMSRSCGPMVTVVTSTSCPSTICTSSSDEPAALGSHTAPDGPDAHANGSCADRRWSTMTGAPAPGNTLATRPTVPSTGVAQPVETSTL